MKKNKFYFLSLFFVLFSACSDDSELEETDDIFNQSDAYSPNNPAAGQITAAEWNDLENWSFFTQLMNNSEWSTMMEFWGIYPQKRYSLVFTDQRDNPLPDLPVVLTSKNGNEIWKGHTDNTGSVELWENLFGEYYEPSTITVIGNQEEYEFTPYLFENKGKMVYVIPEQPDLSRNVDVIFVVDATGSMADEISYLQAEMQNIIERVKMNETWITIRLASVFYRDQGDDYLLRDFPFTENMNEVISFINYQRADGGGDYPEAVDAALLKAINDMQWSKKAVSRLLFLVLDAPPHHEDQQVINNIQRAVKTAAANGIKIIPVTASGINKNTEFLMRFMAISTNSTYTFITDDSGIGNEHLEPTVGPYEIEYLNDLLVRLIQEYSSYENHEITANH